MPHFQQSLGLHNQQRLCLQTASCHVELNSALLGAIARLLRGAIRWEGLSSTIMRPPVAHGVKCASSNIWQHWMLCMLWVPICRCQPLHQHVEHPMFSFIVCCGCQQKGSPSHPTISRQFLGSWLHRFTTARLQEHWACVPLAPLPCPCSANIVQIRYQRRSCQFSECQCLQVFFLTDMCQYRQTCCSNLLNSICLLILQLLPSHVMLSSRWCMSRRGRRAGLRYLDATSE